MAFWLDLWPDGGNLKVLLTDRPTYSLTQTHGEFSCGFSVSLLWWMLYHSLTRDKMMMWKAVSKTKDSNQREKSVTGAQWLSCIAQWLSCGSQRLSCGAQRLSCGAQRLSRTWVSKNIYCTLQLFRKSDCIHTRAWPSTTMIKRQVMNHEKLTLSCQLFQD